MIKNIAIFLLTVSTVSFATISMSSDKVKELSIYDLIKQRNWDNFKAHVTTCRTCIDAGWIDRQMCNDGKFKAELARPWISFDNMRRWAQGLVVLKAD